MGETFINMSEAKITHRGEIKIPTRLLSCALKEKTVKALHLLAYAKIIGGHRIEREAIRKGLKLHDKTARRIIKQIVDKGWAGTDGEYLFPRSWRQLNERKRGGLYLTKVPTDLKRFEALCFAKALKKLYRKRGSSHSIKGRVQQTDFPARYIAASLGISERRLVRLKAMAQRYRFITVIPQLAIVGKDVDYPAIRKNLPGLPVFRKGKHTVVPEVSKIKVLI